jgi:hypothetical protein
VHLNGQLLKKLPKNNLSPKIDVAKSPSSVASPKANLKTVYFEKIVKKVAIEIPKT